MDWFNRFLKPAFRLTMEAPPRLHPTETIERAGKVIAKSQRGAIGQTWWGQQWVQALQVLGADGRLQRGRTYARNGSVRDLKMSYGLITAKVYGSRRTAYQTSLYLRPFTDDQWTQIIQALVQQPRLTAQLLAGEVSPDIHPVFEQLHLSLFPRSIMELQFDCTCPDWGYPCKHAAAVYYLVAEQLDLTPGLIFHLRGCSWVQLRQRLEATHLLTTIPPLTLTEDESLFWGVESLNLLHDLPQRPPEPLALRQWGYPPHQADRHWRTLYTRLGDRAWQWLGLAEEG